MKTIKVSKTGKSIIINGSQQIPNYNADGSKILPNFLECFGEIEYDGDIATFTQTDQYKQLKQSYASAKSDRLAKSEQIAGLAQLCVGL